MIRLLLSIFLMVCATGLAAQDSTGAPRISVDLSDPQTTVGQPLVLRIKILVPSWMPKPPVFPTIEVPNVMVRLPDRATGPVSEKIEGETWSGVQRAYRLYPLAQGQFTLPPGEIAITYAEPGKTDPIDYSVPLPEVTFTATVPAAARDLNPLIIAEGFALEQTIDGLTDDSGDITAGDAVTRTITASISGTTPVMIPRLTPETTSSDAENPEHSGALRAYPDDPIISESENRGDLSGKRVEKTTYLAQQDGTVSLADVDITWFNLKTGKTETATLPGLTLTVTGSDAQPGPKRDPLDLLYLLLVAVFAIGAGRLLLRKVWPLLRQKLAEIRTRWHRCEPYANRQVTQAIRQRDLSQVMIHLDLWLRFFPDATPTDLKDLENALTDLGRAEFGTSPTHSQDWRNLAPAYRSTRQLLKKHERARHSLNRLPPLNPS